MPPRGYSNLTVRREVLELLDGLRRELGFGSYSDLLIYLVRRYRECEGVVEEILRRLEGIEEVLRGGCRGEG